MGCTFSSVQLQFGVSGYMEKPPYTCTHMCTHACTHSLGGTVAHTDIHSVPWVQVRISWSLWEAVDLSSRVGALLGRPLGERGTQTWDHSPVCLHYPSGKGNSWAKGNTTEKRMGRTLRQGRRQGCRDLALPHSQMHPRIPG